MSETKFNPGDIVYHKANNLRMVVTFADDNSCRCTYVDVYGKYQNEVFLYNVLSNEPYTFDGCSIITQLESKAYPKSK